MNFFKWHYEIFIISVIFMIASCLFILKQHLFKEEFSLCPQKEENFSINDQSDNKADAFQETGDQLKKTSLWNKTKSDLSLFSSRNYFSKNGILVDLLEEKTPICPPIPNQWIIDHNLDYADLDSLNKNADASGFTILEKWQGSDPYQSPGKYSSDPTNPKSHPLLWTKLRCNSEALHKKNYYFDFMGIDNNGFEECFKLQPQSPIPDFNTQGKAILSTKIKYIKLGKKIANLPLSAYSYTEKKTIFKEVQYDVSELVLKNIITDEYWKLIRKSTLYPQSTVISMIDSISFSYVLESPPRKIEVQCGDSFELESLPFPEGTEDAEKKDREVYKLIKISNTEATLEREGKEYFIPIL